ncbi:hypothetical protein SynSYN20_01299 [Synechococcus sp. SYN20]|uniref:hypothetical protein n=1 Tax=Synechococcus sp. SYN20 TaxID=1050714 RepID=UPI001644EBF0|nr:hypothetical protein [Synechococcus sp. SYN20]QNJ25633.1 hypothetical protein SynSYN20_01299 [Synechococcus sp. SYN20]
MLAVTGFNSSQLRNIMSISDDLSDALALWIGAPLDAGGILLVSSQQLERKAMKTASVKIV